MRSLLPKPLKIGSWGKEGRARTLVAVFEDHNERMKSLVGQEFEKSTLQRYETCLMHTKEFMHWQYNIKDVPVKQLSFKYDQECASQL